MVVFANGQLPESTTDRVDQKGIQIVTIAKIVTTAKYLQGKVVRAIERGILVSVVVGAFVVGGGSVVGGACVVVGASVVVSPSVVCGVTVLRVPPLHKLVLQQN